MRGHNDLQRMPHENAHANAHQRDGGDEEPAKPLAVVEDRQEVSHDQHDENDCCRNL